MKSHCFFVLFSFLGGCGVNKPLSSFKDEGLYNTTGSLVQLIDRLANNHGLDKSDKNIRLNIARSIQSSFAILCPDAAGTGVFVGENGEFISAAHVIKKDRADCEILTNVQTPNGEILSKKIKALIIVEKARETYYDWDLAVGRVVGHKPNAYLKQARQDRFGRVLAVGYPAHTYRDGMKKLLEPIESENRIKEECRVLSNYYRDLGLKYPANTEISARHESINILCEGRGRSKERFQYSYDTVQKGRNTPAFVSVGSIFYQDQTVVMANSDLHNGMSGGPLVHIETGELLGVLSYSALHKNFGDLEKKVYFGGGVWQKLSQAKLRRFSELPQSRVQYKACLCEWTFYQNGHLSLKTTWVGRERSFSQCQQMSGYRRKMKKLEGLTSGFSNCRLDTIDSYESFEKIGAGSVFVVGKTKEPTVIPHELSKYSEMNASRGYESEEQFPCRKKSLVRVIVTKPELMDEPVLRRQTSLDGHKKCDGYGGDFFKFKVNGRSLKVFVQYNVDAEIDLSDFAQALILMPENRFKNFTQISILRPDLERSRFSIRTGLSMSWWNSTQSVYMIDSRVLKYQNDWNVVLSNLWWKESKP